MQPNVLAALILRYGGLIANIIGLVIIAIALCEGWKINKRVEIIGPFRVSEDPAPGAAADG